MEVVFALIVGVIFGAAGCIWYVNPKLGALEAALKDCEDSHL